MTKITKEFLLQDGFEDLSYANFAKYLDQYGERHFLMVTFTDYDCKKLQMVEFSDVELPHIKTMEQLNALWKLLSNED